MENKDFLIEIGTEEIPVGYIKPSLQQLTGSICEEFDAEGLEYGEVNTFATPRRLVIEVNDLEGTTSPEEETIKGPPEKIAFDKSGNPTKAAKGFANKFGVEVEDLKGVETDKGKYICVQKKIPSRKTSEIISAKLPKMIKNLHFPKRMKWDSSDLSYARPIRWICSLFGEKVIRLKVGNVISDNYTIIRDRGEIFKIEVPNINFYFGKLKEMGIILDHRMRKQYIKSEIEEICSKYNGHVVKFQEKLLEEVNFLAEKPCVFVSEFSKEFIVLPREVLLASMSKYQRVFGIENNEGELLPKFIGVADGKPEDIDTVRENYRSVLESRLQDSLFFYEKDSLTTLVEKVKELKDVIYHKELGSMYEKIKRIKKLCDFLASYSTFEENEINILKRAAYLFKADLVTYMVNEFPSLQGVMGKIYALNDEEDPKVAQAIYEHYLPRFSRDELPEGKFGTLLSIADRIDTLSGYFGIGLIPSGSYDPYGLRRDAYAIVRLMISGDIKVKLDELLQKSIQLFNADFKEGSDVVKEKLLNFIIDKYKSLLLDKYNVPELVDSVLSIEVFNLPVVDQKFKELNNIREEEYFLKAAKVSERTWKIFKNESEMKDKVDESLFEEKLEEELWKIYNDSKEQLNELIDKKDYKEATNLYGNVFFEKVDEFFDEVLVNVEDKKIRKNRLALCKKIYELYNSQVAKLNLLENIEI